MSEWVKVTASDGNELSLYVARPAGEAKGAVVVVQEIFGVNPSIQHVADFYASQGYLAVAPAIFDRFEKDVQLGYDADGMKRAFEEFYPKLDPTVTVLDVAAAFSYCTQAGLKTAVLGFCYGGLMAWVSATLGKEHAMVPACTVGYYAGGIIKFSDLTPNCPVLLHFGADDDHIGQEQVDSVRKYPEVEIHVYDGVGHAFANPDRSSSYNAEAATAADARSLQFLKTHLG